MARAIVPPDSAYLLCRRGYEGQAEIVNVEHRFVAVAAGVLLLLTITGCVGDAVTFEVMQCEALLLGDDAVLDCPGDEAQLGTVQAALLHLPAVGGHDDEATLGQRWNRVGLIGPYVALVRFCALRGGLNPCVRTRITLLFLVLRGLATRIRTVQALERIQYSAAHHLS